MKMHTLLLSIVFASGCEHKTYQLAEVAGRVTHQGQPLTGISIIFQPVAEGASIAGPSAAALVDDSGSYRLQTVERVRRSGAVVGSNRVFLRALKRSTADHDGGYVRDARIPPRFYDGSNVIKVPPQGLVSADFELASP
jgi:hypothetical protein